MCKKFENIEMFLQHLKNKNKSINTIEGYRNDLSLMYQYFLENKNIRKVTYKFLNNLTLLDLESFISHVFSGNSISSATVSRRITAIQTYFSFLQKNKLIKNNISVELEHPKREIRQPIYMTLQESVQFLNSITDKRDYCICTILLHCGLRVSELVSLNVDHIDLENEIVSVIGKGNKQRTVYLDTTCISVLKEYLAYRATLNNDLEIENNENALFLTRYNKRISTKSIRDMINKYQKKTGINKNLTPHKLRHTTASLLYKNGTDIKEIQEILGHSNIATTQIYTHLDNEQLHNAVNNNPLNNVM